VHLSPIFQYYWNIHGTGQEVALVGVRTHFNFWFSPGRHQMYCNSINS